MTKRIDLIADIITEIMGDIPKKQLEALLILAENGHAGTWDLEEAVRVMEGILKRYKDCAHHRGAVDPSRTN